MAIDTETTGLNVFKDTLVGISLANGRGDSWYIPLSHDTGLYRATNADYELVKDALSLVLDRQAGFIIFHNWMFDRHILHNHGFPTPEPHRVRDTQIMAHTMDMHMESFSLDWLTKTYLGHTNIKLAEVAPDKNFAAAPIAEAALYAAEDADVTAQLYLVLLRMLHAGGLMEQCDRNHQFADVLWHMEQRGIMVDVPYLHALSDRYTIKAKQAYEDATAMLPEKHYLDTEVQKRLSKTRKKAVETEEKLKTTRDTTKKYQTLVARREWLQDYSEKLAGKLTPPWNLNSTAHLRHIIFGTFGLTPTEMTPSGKASTAAKVLKTLEHPFPKKVLEYREYEKLNNTYASKLPLLVDSNDRVHGSFNPTGTQTGRISSRTPNLQNIPTRTDEGKHLRKAFIAPAGKKLIAADYSQLELRILAHFSKDTAMVEAFTTNQDIHTRTAAEAYGVPYDEVTKKQRRNAKTINFGIVYGMGPGKFSKEVGCTLEEGREFIDKYFQVYPGIRRFLRTQQETASSTGYIETILGHRRYLPNIFSDDGGLRSMAARQAGNTPIQGSAADIIKVAMINLHNSSTPGELLLQVHDELVWEVDEDKAEQAMISIAFHMEQAARECGITDIPMDVDIHAGDNWAEVH